MLTVSKATKLLADAMQRASAEGERRLVEALHKASEAGSLYATAWLLTHSPRGRDRWSDAGAARAAVNRALGIVVG